MAILFADRVRVNTSTVGTGALTLGSALSGFRSFAAAVTAGSLASGCTVYYCIEEAGGWETGSGVYTAGSPDSLTRVVAASSAGGTTAITLAGAAQVYITLTSAAVTTATTQAQDNNSTLLATTAFVLAQAGTVSPLTLGTTAVGTSTHFARADHVHSNTPVIIGGSINGSPIGATTPSTGAFTTLTATGVVSSKGASGFCSLNSDGTGRGYLAWYNASAVNQGYIGYLNGTSIDFVATGSATTINLYASTVALNATATTTSGSLAVGTSLTLSNGQGFYLKDTGGTARLAMNVDAANYYNICLVNAGTRVRILSASLASELLGVDNSGNTSIAGTLAVTGALNGAAGISTTTLGTSGIIVAGGLITANAGVSTTTLSASGGITGVGLTSTSNITAGTGGGGGGYVTKQGVTGGFGGNATNLYYSAGATQLWVDTTNLGNITVSSDARYKHHISPLDDNALDRIDLLKPVNYRWQDKGLFADDGKIRAGLLAQEIRDIIPSAVGGDEDDPNHVLSINSLPLIATLIKAVQELNAEIKALKAL